ncbi:cytochrome oxidase [Candidatus Tenderia electrophaga]|jgi:cytochrome c oxidase cbb3-type subunit 1|uniref:Cytochrome oxidase n=1 Tax=Candidatus Tenderia electrophaga TaxID=1748243 RepID=A0A0S2T9B7_9GAMM|nr:cytochrome oxidase [Candidatus Tenderia electrophaga]
MPDRQHRHLTKFLAASVTFFFIGSIQGVLQMLPPVRAWLDSIGSPYGGPGHMIDPLAHAHVNLIGGVMMLAMAVTYYLLPRFTGSQIWSRKLEDVSFWMTLMGVICFYGSLILFGVWEGILLLEYGAESVKEVHDIYIPIGAVSATIMGIGLWLFLTNSAMTIYKARHNDDA